MHQELGPGGPIARLIYAYKINASLLEILSTHDLTRRFESLIAVNRVNLSVLEGEIFGLVGPNGAGKSTLIKLLTTLLPVTSGSAEVCGFDIVKQSYQVRRSIGYVPQLVSADGDLTARENLIVSAKLYDVPRAEQAERAESALKFMDLLDVADKRAREFSGGMVRRLEIAQSLLHKPRLLFLDEPTVGLDPVARAAVWKHILGVRDHDRTTILLTTHLMEEVEGLCDRVGMMIKGEMVAIGTSAELKESIGRPDSTLDEVFIHYAGASVEELGSLRDTNRARRTARRLG